MKWFKLLVYNALLISGLYLFLAMINFSWRDLIDQHSLLFLGAGLFFSLCNFSVTEHLQAFGDALGFSPEAVLKTNHQRDVLVFKSLGDYALLAGAVSSGIALIQLLSNVSDLNLLIRGGTLVLLSLLYPLLLRFFILFPLKINLDYQLKKTLWEIDYV